ncbi:MAG: NADPH-dependent glutamate synthase [Deltaproteobacteria bacterium]|nr:NADPH-dependent glutamate synthase [Deltaproteobacteria bacterium]
MPEQEALERIRNFHEVPLGFPTEVAPTEAYRCIWCKDPTCVGGCPVGIDIPAFVHLVEKGDFLGAIRKIKETNVLPAICGRVCPQEDQCEKVCKIGQKKGMGPVSIGRLERFLADWERSQGLVEIPECAPPTGKKVAVVGSGPAGLTCACDLARRGHCVTILEALHKPGGVLVYGIPEFRLPKSIVQAEVEVLRRMGVEIRCNFVVGLTATVDDLLKEYDAVFLGVGAGLPYFMDIPGENLCGIYSANEYLTRVNLMRAYDFPDADTPSARSRKVAVVGGGNVAMDSARTALRLGADEVSLIYRRSKVELPARHEEVERAEEEGVVFRLLENPVRYVGDDDGRVTAVECLKMELGEPDASGRRRPVPVKGSEHLIEVDTVVVAIGNGPNPLVTRVTPEIETRKGGNIVAKETDGRTSKRGVFAGGDIVTGAATVILAMGAGRSAAASIHEYLQTGTW